MSIRTDVASLAALAKVLRNRNLNQSFADVVRTLQKQVPYFDWVGVYLRQGNASELVAASDQDKQLEWEANAELRIPIEDQVQQQELGKIVVKSRDPLCFDMTDVSTLQTLAHELSQRLSLH
ncbi:putative methionine-R-sulfoxide reductase with GAF domain [Caldalkalibacillus uzonensis]|uniref:Methionine-R-sulfoxide reductase with GAF domain n=1 Tax=Caldalkalibacillus uzonensis TaxID=353224 RepID=A0ABU0CUG3_9BACI|nr:GAF domain-containing protein [Caldalkalibacillus uzonensis]MDQ0340060.1 putative methionine-R-sulfoxide reductase with GAF domain [Caldalkalibacillus uzonensis]